MKMIATEKLPVYAGKRLSAGDEFDAEEKDVSTLKLGGLAKDADTHTEPARGKYRRKDLRAEQ